METLLSRQLQQAWLETQMRKEKGDMPAISSNPSNHGLLNSSSEQHTLHTPSSSSSSWDPSAEMSSASAPPQMQSQSLDEEDFRDPVLQYINDMLMNEDLDERKCMMAECLTYNPTLKSFYEIAGCTEAPALPCSNESEPLRVSEQTFKNFLSKEELSAQSSSPVSDALVDDGVLNFHAYEYEDGLRFLDDEGSHLGFSVQNGEKSMAEESAYVTKFLKSVIKEESPLTVSSQDVLNVNGEENLWIDDLFSEMDTVGLKQYASAGVVPSRQTSTVGYSDSSGSSYFSSQNHLNSGFHAAIHEQGSHLNADSISPSSVLTGSPDVSLSWNSTVVQPMSNESGKQNAMLRANKANPNWFHGSNTVSATPLFDAISILPPRTAQVVSNTSRFKRTLSEIDSSVTSDRITSSSSNHSVVMDSMEEEVVSFVRNKDLNAEKYASILNDGIGAVFHGPCGNATPSPAAREDVGKPMLVVTTVADLKGLLISCAQAVASNNIRRAHEILQEIRQEASPYGSGLQRLAHHFAEGLVARLSGTGDRLYAVFTNNSPSAAKMLKAHSLFVKVCPFVKVSTYFANRAILKAAKGASRLHIIDYGILYGIQWPSLMSALAERKGGPPLLRITGIDFPQPGTLQTERVEMTGKRLAEYAKTYGVPFEYQAIASSWETIQPSSLNLKQDEVVVVNCMHRLHNLLDETVLASNPRKTVLNKICEINPKIFVHGIKNGNYNAPFFMSRFKEALTSFSGVFDLFETVMPSESQERIMMEREFLGRVILNVVACEGPGRVERPETYRQWQNRTVKAGFDAIPLDQNVLKESQTIVRCSYNKNFSVDEDGSWVVLSWKGKVAHGLSLWKPASKR